LDLAATGQLAGEKVVWSNGKAKSIAKIVGLNGRSGTVKARFKKPVPALAIGMDVRLL
jgi:ribosomal protein L35AE/L33A